MAGNADIAGYEHINENGVIDHLDVPSTQFDMPVMITEAGVPGDMMDPTSGSPCRADGFDICILVRAADTDFGEWDRIPVDVVDIIQHATPGSRKLELHAKFPILSATVDTEYAIVWGGTGNGEEPHDGVFGRNAVWSDYLGVFHLNEASGNFIDASGNKDAVPQASLPNQVAGPIGFAQDFVSSSGDYALISNPNNYNGIANDFTYTAWTNPDALDGIDRLFGRGSGSGGFGVGFSGVNGLATSYAIKDYVGSSYSINSWQLYHMTWDSSNDVEFFKDGVANGAATGITDITTGSQEYRMGSESGAEYYNGQMKEVRISNSVQSDDSITTQANNQINNATFATTDNVNIALVLPTTVLRTIPITAQMGAGAITVSPSIGETVDVSRSYLVYSYRTSDASGTKRFLMAGEIVNSTTLQFNVNSTGVLIDIEGYVIEYTKDSAIRISHGFATDTVASSFANLDASVNTDKTWPMLMPGIINTTGWNGGECIDYTINTDGNELHFDRSGTNSIYLVWQVITHHNSIVQTKTFSSDLSSFNTSITAVDLAKTFAYASTETSSLIGLNRIWRVTLDSTTNVNLQSHAGSTTRDGHIYIVEYTDDTIVESIQITMAAADNDEDGTISAVNLDTAWIVNGTSDYFISGANNSTILPVEGGEGCISQELTTSTNVKIKRNGSSDGARVTLYVMHQPVSGINSALVNGGLITMGLTSRGLVR